MLLEGRERGREGGREGEGGKKRKGSEIAEGERGGDWKRGRSKTQGRRKRELSLLTITILPSLISLTKFVSLSSHFCTWTSLSPSRLTTDWEQQQNEEHSNRYRYDFWYWSQMIFERIVWLNKSWLANYVSTISSIASRVIIMWTLIIHNLIKMCTFRCKNFIY